MLLIFIGMAAASLHGKIIYAMLHAVQLDVSCSLARAAQETMVSLPHFPPKGNCGAPFQPTIFWRSPVLQEDSYSTASKALREAVARASGEGRVPV